MRKKVGRPIAYKGDPNAANLTEAERRRIKRRIANRESARRVRARRQETLEELHIRVSHSAFIHVYTSGRCVISYCWVVSAHMLCLFISSLLDGHLQMDQISVHNGHMVKHIADGEGHTVLLKGQLEECERQWNRALAENARLQQTVSVLRAKFQVCIEFVLSACSLGCCCWRCQPQY